MACIDCISVQSHHTMAMPSSAPRFRVSRDVYNKKTDGFTSYDAYYAQGRDCTGNFGVRVDQDISAAFRLWPHE